MINVTFRSESVCCRVWIERVNLINGTIRAERVKILLSRRGSCNTSPRARDGAIREIATNREISNEGLNIPPGLKRLFFHVRRNVKRFFSLEKWSPVVTEYLPFIEEKSLLYRKIDTLKKIGKITKNDATVRKSWIACFLIVLSTDKEGAKERFGNRKSFSSC